MSKGWRKESARHSLSARGIKTKSPNKSWHGSKVSVAKQFHLESDIMDFRKLFIWPNPRANKSADKILVEFIHNKDDIEYFLKNNPHVTSNLVVVPFLNGRERGYTARYANKEVSWCEHRNSDSIVVYPFDWFGDNIKNDFKTKTKDFGKDETAAFKFILKELKVQI